ncbi:hypothetical protein JRO89_XS05G0014900 [Xanthoceras sorbifolium]|uniref:DUF4283 domain-containing protein n=1 Tax=Xanthoceras sorbifolium TaxID=99658 RepID=A0ABQ8I0A1_9ROSI|nr:hypothetical protein JRO89_XS05G0014900 [Xanthoceras sorbifolium]
MTDAKNPPLPPIPFFGSLEAISHNGDIDGMKFEKVEFWVQVHNIPLICMTHEIGLYLGCQIGLSKFDYDGWLRAASSVRPKIGDRTYVSIYCDMWIPHPVTFKVQFSVSFPLHYRHGIESITHALWSCRTLKTIRDAFGFLNRNSIIESGSMNDVLLLCKNVLSLDEFQLLAIILRKSILREMASIKSEKPAGTQLPVQGKKEAVKVSSSTPKAPPTKPAPKKSEQKPAPKKKV